MKSPPIPRFLVKSCARLGFLRLVDPRIVGLTLLNACLWWPWHLLRVTYDAGDHHPGLVLGMLALTVWTWAQLMTAVINRAKEKSEGPDGLGARLGSTP